MGGPGKPTAPAFGDPGAATKGIANKGTGNKGTGNKLTENKGTANKLTENKGTAPGPSATTYLAGATELEFADVVVGDVVQKELWVINAHLSSEAYLQATIDSPRPRVTDVAPFQLIDLPQRLRPSREGLGVPGKIVFQPTQVGDYGATVTVTARWQDRSVPDQRLVIAIRGWSREEGQPTRAAVRAVATAAADKVRAEQQRTRVRAAMQKRYEQETDEPYPQSKLNALTKAFELAKLALVRITDGQHSAIKLAEDEAGAFKRRPPPSSEGLARAIAALALDVVGAGIAGRLGAKVVAHFATREVSVAPGRVFFRDPKTRRLEAAELLGPARMKEIPALLSDAGLAALDEMVQATVLGILAPDDDAAAAKSGERSAEQVQKGLEFFFDQREAVNDLKKTRGDSLVVMQSLLWPFLRKEADAAVMAMEVFRKQLGAEQTTAAAIQAASTRHAWMSFLSQYALGSLTAGQLLDRGLRLPERAGATVTDVARLAVPFKDGKPPPYDGVLDVYLAAELHRPEAPITVARLHMNGVTQAMLSNSLVRADGDGTTGARFSELRVVMRIIPTAPGVLDFGVVVVRDEVGNVFSSDMTGATPQDRTWLARRAGRRTASAAAQHEGAVALVNDLLQVVVPLKGLEALGAMSTDAA